MNQLISFYFEAAPAGVLTDLNNSNQNSSPTHQYDIQEYNQRDEADQFDLPTMEYIRGNYCEYSGYTILYLEYSIERPKDPKRFVQVVWDHFKKIFTRSRVR
jgi:hypothetical protein